jgi:hypothetical protein
VYSTCKLGTPKLKPINCCYSYGNIHISL